MQKVILFALLGCQGVVETAVEPEDLSGIADAYCAANPHLPCGKVYACATPADNELGLIELCVPQFIDVSAVEAVHGECQLSPHERFAGANLCWWCCGEGCTRGCNAFDGCFCDAPEEDGSP